MAQNRPKKALSTMPKERVFSTYRSTHTSAISRYRALESMLRGSRKRRMTK